MPGGDRTGPIGAGPMTGRTVGFCAGYQAPGCLNPAGRFGWGRGQGYGWDRGAGWGGHGMGWRRGRGGGFWPAWGSSYAWGRNSGFFGGPVPCGEDELDMLKQQASQMETALNDIRKRMDELIQDQTEKEQTHAPGR